MSFSSRIWVAERLSPLLFKTKQHVSILDTVIFVAEGLRLKFPSGLKCLHAGSMYDSCPRQVFHPAISNKPWCQCYADHALTDAREFGQAPTLMFALSFRQAPPRDSQATKEPTTAGIRLTLQRLGQIASLEDDAPLDRKRDSAVEMRLPLRDVSRKQQGTSH